MRVVVASGSPLLFDGSGSNRYPETATALEPSVFEEAASKRLGFYVESPASLPGVHPGPSAAGTPAWLFADELVGTAEGKQAPL